MKRIKLSPITLHRYKVFKQDLLFILINQTKTMKKTNVIRIQYIVFIALFLCTSILSGCKKKNEEANPAGAYQNGVFIVNEGPFNSGTGTVSHYNKESKVVTNTIFELANNFPLGNIVQSMNVFNGKGYIVVNNGNKIEAVNSEDFKSVGTIVGLDQPRNILQIDNEKAYVTEWGADGLTGSIKVINIPLNVVSKTISIGRKGSEEMIKKGNLVYVTCKGGYGNDSVVAIINTTSDQLVNTITVGPSPETIVEDANGSIWILCGGEYGSNNSLVKTGRLVKLNSAGNAVETSFTFSSTFSQPSGLCLNADKTILYYNYDGKICSQLVTSTTLEETVVATRSFYCLGVDPTTNIIYAGDAGNFTSNGKVFRYNSTGGNPIDSFEVGIIPGSIFFK
jgi:hypothetical protein